MNSRTPPAGDSGSDVLAELMRDVARRHEPALARLYRLTASRAYAMSFGIARRRCLAEAAVEESYWQVWNEAANFDPLRGGVMAWLLTITRSRTLDAMRRESRHPSGFDDADALDHLAAPSACPCDSLSQRQQSQLLHGLVDKLEPLPRQLLAMAFARGLTHEEIAEHSGLPAGTVKSHIRRALGQLRGRLQRRGVHSSTA